jgi:hypothetical protein
MKDSKSKDQSSQTPQPTFLTIAEFCMRLNITRNFYLRRLRELGVKSPGHRLSVEEQKILCEYLGMPFWGDGDEK